VPESLYATHTAGTYWRSTPNVHHNTEIYCGWGLPQDCSLTPTMILLDEFDDCAPLKSPEAQSLPRTEPQEQHGQQPPVQSQQQLQQGDLPPPYSRPNTPAPQSQRRQDSDAEANNEQSRERGRRKKRRSFAHSAKKYAVWGLGTLLFMMIWRFLLFNRVDWMVCFEPVSCLQCADQDSL
jgi:hypothetical protein